MKNSVLNIGAVDLFNLVVFKAINFALVAIIFFLIRRDIDTASFVDFGFYWGLALMIGGILFGGLASTLVRLVSIKGRLSNISSHPGIKGVGLVFFFIFIINVYIEIQSGDLENLIVVSMFSLGAVIQLHFAVMAILRAEKASMHLLMCALSMLILVPGVFLLTHAADDSIAVIFRCLLYAYFASSIAVCFFLGLFLNAATVTDETPLHAPRFRESYFSFTLINIFSYTFVMIDFYLLRNLLDADVLNGAGVAKIYFDRFVIPLLSLVTGVVSLNILRSKTETLVGNVNFTVRYVFNPKKAAMLMPVLPLILLGYYFYSEYGSSVSSSLGFFQAGLLLAGYCCYSLNGIFFDVFVVRYTAYKIFIGILVYLGVSYLSYYVAIVLFGLAGWVGAFFLLNCIGTCIFVLIIRVPMRHEKLA